MASGDYGFSPWEFGFVVYAWVFEKIRVKFVSKIEVGKWGDGMEKWHCHVSCEG